MCVLGGGWGGLANLHVQGGTAHGWLRVWSNTGVRVEWEGEAGHTDQLLAQPLQNFGRKIGRIPPCPSAWRVMVCVCAVNKQQHDGLYLPVPAGLASSFGLGVSVSVRVSVRVRG